MPPRKNASLTKRLEASKPRGRKPAPPVPADETTKNPLVEARPFIEATPGFDDFEKHLRIIDFLNPDNRLHSHALTETMEALKETGAARDAKTLRAIRYLRASLRDPESVTLACNVIAIPLGLGFWLYAMARCGGLV